MLHPYLSARPRTHDARASVYRLAGTPHLSTYPRNPRTHDASAHCPDLQVYGRLSTYPRTHDARTPCSIRNLGRTLSTYPCTHDARANHGLITYVLHFLPHVRVRRLYGLLGTGLSSLPKRQRTLSRVALRHAMCRITGTNSAYGVTVRRKSQCEHRASAMKASASHRIIFVLSSPG